MRLTQRLWLVGAGVPTLGVLLALWLAGQLFERHLARSLDQALLSQAASEAVSLFDGPGGMPHLHLDDSPLAEVVAAFAPVAEVYGPDGTLRVAFPPTRLAPAERLVPPREDMPPRLETVEGPEGGRLRRLTVLVRSHDGAPHLLRLSASLAQQEAASRAFRNVALALAAVLGLVLLALQTWQARWLAGRLAGLRRRIARMREGGLAGAPAPRPGGDEVDEVESALGEAAERLHAAREAQEQLIARAAHELRTPLALMRTSLDLALWKERDAARMREALEETRREVERLSALAGVLLDLASFGRGGFGVDPGDLRELCEEAADAARAEAEGRGVLLTVEGPSPAPGVFHAPSVRQALDNLLSNALRYAPKGTEVVVGLAREGAGWRLAVRDRGPGIPSEHRESVFTPFYRVEPAGPGTGLGLSVVQEVARRHGGRAYVVDAPGPGAEVALELPAFASGTEAAEE
ncbi:HAMP domain-containing sensor histidine kinase [Myxococcaceae bacterium GXIMD 01537]